MSEPTAEELMIDSGFIKKVYDLILYLSDGPKDLNLEVELLINLMDEWAHVEPAAFQDYMLRHGDVDNALQSFRKERGLI